MQFSELSGKKILLLGFGVEGQDSYLFLRKNFPNQLLGIADQGDFQNMTEEIRSLLEQDGSLNLYFGEEYLKSLESYDVVIKAPGISFLIPEITNAKARGTEFTSATKIFFANAKGTIIGVTGTKGKSTTASLLFEVLKEAEKDVHLIGNIGQPPLQYLANDSAEKTYVYELSSYQLEDLSISPHIGLITNMYQAHLDHHGTREEYAQAKLNMFRFMKQEDTAIYNSASSEVGRFLENIPCGKISYNDGLKSTVSGENILHNGEIVMSVHDVPLLGKHNLENILGVIACAKLLKISNETIKSAISKFKGLEHRLEFVGEFQGKKFYNDSISTTPESTIAAIEAFPRELGTLVLGGVDSGFDFTKLGEEVSKAMIPALLLFPEAGEKILASVQEACKKSGFPLPKFVIVQNMMECIEQAFLLTPQGKICLLSPACPSTNLFKNFQERGKMFREEVMNFALRGLHNP